MSRDELKGLVKHTFAWELVGESGSVEEGEDELLDAMVAAYNRALDDALEAVKLEKASNYGRFSEDPSPAFKPLLKDVFDVTYSGHGDCGYDAVRVDRSSIESLKI